ncbi:MAG: hypothetical protein HY587_07075 [Candidatus Omnitrophica bacterium]|nr:hypothetical protein [Candidatus Omnitrophota bacterium]
MRVKRRASARRKFAAFILILLHLCVLPSSETFGQSSDSHIPIESSSRALLHQFTEKLSQLQELATIEESHEGEGDSFIVLVRDVHVNTDVQTRIAQLIQSVTGSGDIVLLEGTPGSYAVDYFREFPIKHKRDRVLKDLLRQRSISGPEFAAMTHREMIQLVGIDEERLYVENLHAYHQCIKQQRDDLNILVQVRKEFDRAANQLFVSALKTFLKRTEILYSRPDYPLSFARYLAEQAERADVSLSDLRTLPKLIEVLNQKLPLDGFEENFIEQILNDLPADLEIAENRIAETIDQRNLVKVYLTARRYFRHLEKALRLTLTPGEKVKFLTLGRELNSTGNPWEDTLQLTPQNREALKLLQNQIPMYIRFYDLAESRDCYLIKNIEHELKRRKKNWAVAVMGGYHTQNVLNQLRERGISYLCITPKFSLRTDEIKTPAEQYRDVMVRSKSLFGSLYAASHVIPLSNIQPSLVRNNEAVRDLYQSAGNGFIAGMDKSQRDDVIQIWDRTTRGIFLPTSGVPVLRRSGSWLYVSPQIEQSVFLGPAPGVARTKAIAKGFGANGDSPTVFVDQWGHIQGSVGPIEVNWRWHPDSNVVLIIAHKLGGTRHSIDGLLGDVSRLDFNASVVTYKSSRLQEARPDAVGIHYGELLRVFGQKDFTQEVEDLRIVIRETLKLYEGRTSAKPPKIILIGQEHGGQLLPIVASEPEFSNTRHLILIRTPVQPLNKVMRGLYGPQHPILNVPDDIGDRFAQFPGTTDVILWRGDESPGMRKSGSQWLNYAQSPQSVRIESIGNGTFANSTTVQFFQERLRELTDRMARGFGSDAPPISPETIRTDVEEAMLRWFNPGSDRSGEMELSRFLASRGELAIDTFVALIEADRSTKLGPYKIPEYRSLDQLPEAGTLTTAPKGRSFTLPFDAAEFEQMRINLMAEIVIQRALGREISVHVGAGHVAQANMALASEARAPLDQQEGNRFRGTISAQERPYFSIAYQRPTSRSGYAVHFINDGLLPHPTTDQEMIRNFRTARSDGVIAATFLPEVMAVADVVLVETELEMHAPPRGTFQQAHINTQPTAKLLETIGSLIRKDALVVIESTVQPGFVSKEALPAIDRVMRDRFPEAKEGGAPYVRLAYSPQRLAPGAEELRSLRDFRRESAAFSPAAREDLERYFKKIGFTYKVWNVSEDVEFLKLLELSWFYDLLEILDGYLKTAEVIGVDAFQIIEGIVRAHPRSRMGMRRAPSMCPGGSCTPEALLKIVVGLRTYFEMEDDQIFRIFQSRLLASSMLQERAKDVTWKLLNQFTGKMHVQFSEITVGVLGTGYKEGTGNTKHSGSEHVVREMAHFGGRVEATDPYTDFWPELALQQPRGASSQARGRLNQDDLNSIPFRKVENPLEFFHPKLDALVFATRHFEYVGSNQPVHKRREHPDAGTRRKTYPGLDPIKAVAHMMGLEDKIIVDTYDFFSDADYRIFLALDWRIETFGKGHIYNGSQPLFKQITANERIAHLTSLLKELGAMKSEPDLSRQDEIDQAIRTAGAKLAYWKAFANEGEKINNSRLRYEYDRQKATQNLLYATGRRRHTAELEKELADARLHQDAADSSIPKPTRSIKDIEDDLFSWQEDSKIKAEEFLQSKVLSPVVRSVSTTLRAQGKLAISLGETMSTIVSDVPASGVIGLTQGLATMQHGILGQTGASLEALFTSPHLDRVRSDIARDERTQQERPDLRISERSPRVPDWAKDRAHKLGFKGKFLVSHIYRRDHNGRMQRHTDPDDYSNRITVKWVGDMQESKRTIPDVWTKFSLEVPLHLVPVEDLQVELYEDFMRLPWELREWLTKEVWGQGKILSTVDGEAQTKLRYMMEVNLDPDTVAPGRGGMLFWMDSGEPVLIVSDMGAEFIVDLKSAGPFMGGRGENIRATGGRVVQGGAGDKNEAGQHVVTRVDLGALYPGHQAGGEGDVIHLLRLVGTDAYFNGAAPRALFRLRFRYPGNDTRFEIIGRASPTNQRIGHIFKGGGEDFDPGSAAQQMGWNAAEILTHHIANVHIALNPDNTLATGYYTDAGSNIDLFNERDPLKSFKKYFGYYLQLVAYDFNQAREFGKDSYEAPIPELDFLQDWLSAFFDHLLESRYVANSDLLRELFQPLREIDRGAGPDRFRYKDHTDPIQILSHVIDDLSDVLWKHYLPYQLLRNRLDMGYDATRESIYSTTSGDVYNPDSGEAAERFVQAQVELIDIAEELINKEGYPPLNQWGEPFDFREARRMLEQKRSDIRTLSQFQFPTPARYAGIYQIPFYSPPRPEVFTVVDINTTSQATRMQFRVAPIRSNNLISKAPAAWLRDVEPAVRRIHQFAAISRLKIEGDFKIAPLIGAYFDAWGRLGETTADLFALNKPWDVVLQIHQDFLNAGARGGELGRLRAVDFKESFALQEKYYARLGLEGEEIFIEASVDGDKQFRFVDNEIFTAALNKHSGSFDTDAGTTDGTGFGSELSQTLKLVAGSNPLIIRERGQEAMDAVSVELGEILLPGTAGKKVGSLIIDDSLFLNQILEAGKSARRTVNFVFHLDGFKQIYLIGLPELSQNQREIVAGVFGVPLDDIVIVTDDPDAFSLANHYNDPIVAALSGRHENVLGTLQAYALLHPNTVLLLAGENFPMAGVEQMKRIGIRVLSTTNVLEMISDAIEMVEVFAKAA